MARSITDASKHLYPLDQDAVPAYRVITANFPATGSAGASLGVQHAATAPFKCRVVKAYCGTQDVTADGTDYATFLLLNKAGSTVASLTTATTGFDISAGDREGTLTTANTALEAGDAFQVNVTKAGSGVATVAGTWTVLVEPEDD